MKTKRQGIIIWFHHRRNLKQIKRYGHLVYASMRLKYAVLYVDQESIDEIEEKIGKLSFVKKTMRSFKPFVRTDYEKVKLDKEEKYDYNMEI